MPGAQGAWWVVIERDDDTDLVLGPYPAAADAEHACESAALVVALVAENCLECFVTKTAPGPPAEHVLVDLKDSDHTGR